MADFPPDRVSGLRRILTQHPVISAVLLSCALVGAVVGGLHLPPEWSLLRRAAAGGIAGFGAGLLVTATRMIG